MNIEQGTLLHIEGKVQIMCKVTLN